MRDLVRDVTVVKAAIWVKLVQKIKYQYKIYQKERKMLGMRWA